MDADPDGRDAGALSADQVSDGHLALGPGARFPEVPRWATVASVPDRPLPPIPRYQCLRAAVPPEIDGRLDEAVWARAEWSAPFGRIDDGRPSGQETRIALLWDDRCLYAAYRAADRDVRGTATRHHEQVYMKDDDVEIFVQGDGGYYELGVNPVNTVYEFRWTWLQPLVERQDFGRLEELLKRSDTLYYTARPGEKLGRIGDMTWELPGLRHAVQVDGTLNNPADFDRGWTVEFALPWDGLAPILGGRPKPGTTLRIQAYRAEHDRSDPEKTAAFARHWPGGSPFTGYTWSTMGNGNVHNPERWAEVVLLDAPV